MNYPGVPLRPGANATVPESVDLVIVGSGAAGLSAAAVGADLGLSVLVLEKAETIGGTTAYMPRVKMPAESWARSTLARVCTWVPPWCPVGRLPKMPLVGEAHGAAD